MAGFDGQQGLQGSEHLPLSVPTRPQAERFFLDNTASTHEIQPGNQ